MIRKSTTNWISPLIVAKKRVVNVALSNTFGFGGHNASLIFKNTRTKPVHTRDVVISSLVPFKKDKILYTAINNLLGFYPRNIYLYKVALSHKSAPQVCLKGQQVNNERLEYLGDAVLSSVVADYLYKKFPYQHEGFLTEMRSKLVSRSRFNKLSLKMGLTN